MLKVLAKVGTVAYRLKLPQQLSRVHNTFHVSNLKKCLSDEPLAIPLDELHIDDKLRFVEDPLEIMDREIKRLRQSRIPIIKVRWNSNLYLIRLHSFVFVMHYYSEIYIVDSLTQDWYQSQVCFRIHTFITTTIAIITTIISIPLDTITTIAFTITIITLTSSDDRDDILEADMLPRKKACFTAPTRRFEVRESLAAIATRQTGHVLTSGSIMDSKILQETEEMYTRHMDAYDDRALLQARISTLKREDRSQAMKAQIRALHAEKTPMTDAIIKKLIAQGIVDALDDYEANRDNGNGDDNYNSRSSKRIPIAANNLRALEEFQKVVTCYECGVQSHYKKDCPKLKKKNHQAGNGEAHTMAYALEGNKQTQIRTSLRAQITEKKAEDKSEKKRLEDVPIV
nr:hypothetical protein [Tanacetum cinerariifolium]